MTKYIGVSLEDGPYEGWSNVYSADPLGGWPPPERLACIGYTDPASGADAVAVLTSVPPSMEHEVTWYRKTRQSDLPDDVPETIVRGAVYAVEEAQAA